MFVKIEYKNTILIDLFRITTRDFINLEF